MNDTVINEFPYIFVNASISWDSSEGWEHSTERFTTIVGKGAHTKSTNQE